MFKELNFEILSSWPPGNYDNPTERRGSAIYVVAGIFVSLATATLFARMYSRIWIRRYFGPDDGLIIFAWLASLGVTVCAILGHLNHGWDRHVWDIRPIDFPDSLKILYFARIFWGFATSAVRLSICLLYMRLLNRIGVGPSHFRCVLYGFTAFQVALFFVYIFAGIFPCMPIRAYWSLTPIPGQRCTNDSAVMKACAILNTLSEFTLAAFPIIAVYKLNIEKAQRLTVISLLSLGFLVGLAGCFRTYYLWLSVSAQDLDMSWWADPHWIASEVEIDLAIVCACAAPLRPLFSYIARKLRGLPSQLPTIRGKRPSFSTYASKRSEMGYDFQPGWVAPRPQYFDLEGLPCDGYGYTVVISGPTRKRSRLRFRKSIRETEAQQPVLQRPEPTRDSAGSRMARRGSPQDKYIKLDIAMVKEVDVTHSRDVSRSSQEKFKPYVSQSSTPEHYELGGRSGKSWFDV